MAGCPDDYCQLSCSISSSATVAGHTEYTIQVIIVGYSCYCSSYYQHCKARDILIFPDKVSRAWGAGPPTWQTCRRYSDFVALQGGLQEAGLPLPLPKKKVVGNLDREFVLQRQSELQEYLQVWTGLEPLHGITDLQALLERPLLANSLPTRRFLDPDTYALNFQGGDHNANITVTV